MQDPTSSGENTPPVAFVPIYTPPSPTLPTPALAAVTVDGAVTGATNAAAGEVGNPTPSPSPSIYMDVLSPLARLFGSPSPQPASPAPTATTSLPIRESVGTAAVVLAPTSPAEEAPASSGDDVYHADSSAAAVVHGVVFPTPPVSLSGIGAPEDTALAAVALQSPQPNPPTLPLVLSEPTHVPHDPPAAAVQKPLSLGTPSDPQQPIQPVNPAAVAVRGINGVPGDPAAGGFQYPTIFFSPPYEPINPAAVAARGIVGVAGDPAVGGFQYPLSPPVNPINPAAVAVRGINGVPGDPAAGGFQYPTQPTQ